MAVFAQSDGGVRRLFAVAEDGQSLPVAISPAGISAQYAGTLSGRRIVYATVAPDGSLLSVRRVLADGSGDELLGLLEPSAYRAARGAWEVAGRAVVQLTRQDGSAELIATGPSLPGIGHLASGRWVGAAGDRAVYLARATSAIKQAGDLRSVRIDGSGDLALGGGDADDLFHGLAGAAVLLTEHASAAAEIHSVGADGSGRVSRAGSLGTLYAGGLLVASRGAQLERLDSKLAPTALGLPVGAAALVLRDDGSVIAHAAGQGLFAADGKTVSKLDAFAADRGLAAQVAEGSVFYTANNAQGSFLRSARLDGSSSLTLSSAQGHELLFSGLLPGGRALFFRTAGSEIGGRLMTVALDATGERAVGDDATGTLRAADHDFGGLSKSGRLFFEAELVEHAPPRLFVLDAQGVRALTSSGEYTSLSALLN